MTFKAGDIVVALNSALGSYTKGKVYIVKGMRDDNVVLTECDDTGCTSNGWGAWNFKLAERPVIKNDIEWLDRVQKNFKD